MLPKKRLPKKFLLGPRQFICRWNPGLDGEDCHGRCGCDEGIIEINPKSDPKLFRDTLLHEYIEAINGVYDLGLSHQAITTLATALLQILESQRY